MKEKLLKIKEEAVAKINAAAEPEILEAARVEYLGKKGELTQVLRGMGALSPEERPAMGQLVNEVREAVESAIENRRTELSAKVLEARLEKETLDVTIPGEVVTTGRRHPLNAVLGEMIDIFTKMGFDIADGPEVEYDYYNFEALNIPKDHPARDTQDTFYFNENMLLRTQTSSVQIRVMENNQPPIRIVAPGRVYRSDAVDATHSPLFHQMEGLVVDKGITFTDLKGTLENLAKMMYGEDAVCRFRPHHFPFTEPSAEMDIQCFACKGEGCRLCKGEGWIEVLGAGMVHPKVLRNCNIDPDVYSGFAFGIGLERITMRRYNLDDLRLLFENDLRFLSQF